MSVTNQLSKQLLSKRKISGGSTYTYAGVIDTIGGRGMGAYIDNKSAAFGGTCLNQTAANAQCCGDNGPPYNDPNTCNYYYVQFAANPSSSFSSSPYAGYYDASSKKGFKSFAVSSYSGTTASDTAYYTCATNCASTTEQNMIDGNAYFGDSAFAGIKEADGTLWTWGYNNYGQLGNNSTVRTKSPVQLGSNSWKMVSGGGQYYFCAIRSDDTLWTWGYNGNGSLGDNSTLDRSSPVQVAGSWKYISAGYLTCTGIKSDDTLWTWGYNFYGGLGDNSTVSRSSPVQVSGGGSWKYVFSGLYNTHAIKTNGTMYGWGWNSTTWPTVGDNTGTLRSSPVQIGTSFSDWTHVRTNSYVAGNYAIRSDGTAYAWGYYPYGLSSGIYSLPTQIGLATNHASCSLGYAGGYNSYIGGEYCSPFITTDNKVIAYNGYNSTQVTKYNGGGATQLIIDSVPPANSYNSNNNVFLMKYIQ